MKLTVLSALFSCFDALKNIGKERTLDQLPSIFTVKYLRDFTASSECDDFVSLLKYIDKTPLRNQIAISSHLNGGANGASIRANAKLNNLQLLLKDRSLFTIALAIALHGWFQP
jgi:hypothetical protein